MFFLGGGSFNGGFLLYNYFFSSTGLAIFFVALNGFACSCRGTDNNLEGEVLP